ncbi:hypothetical protein SAMN04487926_12124 [Paraburkholderia steynii]|uniref:Mobilization protein n=1 Tax=Paraburkholderia steynii TaxID=1245441 RepID=A0A7Z7BBX1_9BURK|nr:hypothetical protein [Paraburkholderia steynii]SDI64648.1 hypothetical protein SAMN04487926_12124 [Paraburkholderia steynii]
MSRTKASPEELAARRQARAEKIKAAREEKKSTLRKEIEALASRIPSHVIQGGVQTVRAWKDALDAATGATELSRVSVDRLTDLRDALQLQVE